jgi:hypothetical protein
MHVLRQNFATARPAEKWPMTAEPGGDILKLFKGPCEMSDDRTDQAYIDALREENEYLRQAARMFGELAERLARQLGETTRRAQLRASLTRDRGDKRHSWPAA